MATTDKRPPPRRRVSDECQTVSWRVMVVRGDRIITRRTYAATTDLDTPEGRRAIARQLRESRAMVLAVAAL